MAKRINSVDVLAQGPFHGGNTVHAGTEGCYMPGAWRAGLNPYAPMAVDEGPTAKGVGPERLATARRELDRSGV